ncbi:MAG: galactosyldiacylglycerol synthase, partial [Clostridiales bacterium]|nr:galactosyldiacylglycerol synthase [Clostridiales bacterium]
FVDNVDEMMDAADCIITKPGGLTTTESLAKQLPMIILNPIPGHEERNSEFLTNNGVAIEVTKTFPLEDAMHFMFHNPRRLELMKESISLCAKPNATNDIADLVHRLVERKE